MSVNITTYCMLGMKLPYIDDESFHEFCDSLSDGMIDVVMDVMNGQYIVIGYLIAKSGRDDYGVFDDIVTIDDILLDHNDLDGLDVEEQWKIIKYRIKLRIDEVFKDYGQYLTTPIQLHIISNYT